MHTLIIAITIIHVLAGTVALLVGLVSMFSKKGGKAHNRSGLVYVWGMIVVAATALPMCALQPFKLFRLFLTGIAVLSFYLCMTGWRATKQKKSGPTPADRLLTYVALVVSVGMMGFGAYLLKDGVSVFAILFPFFGFLTFKNAWYDAKLFSRTPEKMHWFYHHIARMGGSYIATFTAFLVNNMYRMMPVGTPEWVGTIGWIAPTLVGGVLIARTIRHYKQKFDRPKTVLA
ncbi:DUF2306 domain-containing protein [Spirosoma rhododendri]|uniref:DUF2306 domain-containing protein n=1 Tax=Spirosoma rhododendri TaxID=2728024 RepID=A0A7L5DKX6_9BACT|nr:DUF2306 domain-containing protein [Spirosoma rhododendri]QJD78182.1 DUF2306 domain-containing protein [Spirosoma rhododendri]